MKNLIISAFLLISASVFSQTIIGDNIGTATDKTSVLPEFANTNNKGIILPYVRVLPVAPSEGTILLDSTNPLAARVKYFNGSWVDLSGQNANVTTAFIDQPTVVQAPELPVAKTIIGAVSLTADGVLVLESATQAMLLPIVSDVNNIPNPSAGMMVFVNKAGAKRLAVYNSAKWSFWKPAS